MDVGSIFSGAGATTIVGALVFMAYKLLSSSHCRSKCCGREVSIDMQSSTPTRRTSQPTIPPALVEIMKQTIAATPVVPATPPLVPAVRPATPIPTIQLPRSVSNLAV